MIKLSIGRSSILVILLTLVVAAAGLTVGAWLGQASAQGGKQPPNPEAGMTDSQREALHAAAHARNDAYLHAFMSAHQDPHGLPIVWVPDWAAPPATLQAAVQAAHVIVQGTVLSVGFAVNPSGGLPMATARIQVTRSVKGQPPSVVTVVQEGGPVAHGKGGALAELESDQLVLSGDQVVLMLTQPATGSPFRTVPGAGVYLVENGTIAGESSETYKVKGLPLAQFLAQVSSAG